MTTDNNLTFTLHTENEALDVMSSGLDGCVFTPADVHPDFYDFSNGIAGGIMQKFVNYNFPVAFVLPDDPGPRVVELARDHRNHPCVRFFDTHQAALEWLNNRD